MISLEPHPRASLFVKLRHGVTWRKPHSMMGQKVPTSLCREPITAYFYEHFRLLTAVLVLMSLSMLSSSKELE